MTSMDSSHLIYCDLELRTTREAIPYCEPVGVETEQRGSLIPAEAEEESVVSLMRPKVERHTDYLA